MGPIPRNIVANLAGQGWAAAMSLLLVPLYVRLLGVEAYGLIGFYATLQGSLRILDLGLSQTMNRQMAHYQAFPDRAGEARDFVRTIELGYWAVGVVIGAALVVAAPLIARHWLNVGSVPVETAERAITVMGVVAALQWPLSFYEGGLMGLQRQVLVNALKIAVATVGGVGTALVLWLWSPTITAYFGWQVAVAAAGVGGLAVSLWHCLPRAAGRAAFRPALISAHWRLAAGMGGIAVSGILLSQLDKVLLSKLLSLEAFGYYTLAGVVSNVIPVIVAAPVFNGIFPQLTTFAAAGSEGEVSQLYHRGTQLMAVLVASVAGVVALFSYDILLAWTRNAVTAASVAPIASVLVIGMAINALDSVPYALQLAHGWTSFGLRINTGLMILLVPTIVVMTSRFGPIGGAGAWVILNTAYMLVAVPLMHRKLLKGEMRAWFTADILPPAVAALAVIGAGRWLAPRGTGIVTVLAIGVVLVVALVAAGLAAPLVRKAAVDLITRPRATGER